MVNTDSPGSGMHASNQADLNIVPLSTLLQNVCLAFAELSQENITLLDRESKLETFERGTYILQQQAEWSHVIIDGYVVATHTDEQHDKNYLFQIVSKGFLFGKDGLFGIADYNLSYKALTTVKTVRIAKDVMEAIAQSDAFKNYILNELSDEVRALRWRASNNALSIERKVIKLLLMLCERFGRPTEQNGYILNFKLTNSDMAHMLDATRESVNRTLNKIADKGLITLGSPGIFISNKLNGALADLGQG